MSESIEFSGPGPVVQLGAGIASDLADYARETIGRLLHHRGRAGAQTRVHVVRHGDPARSHPVEARALVDMDGTPVAVHVDAKTPREAVDKLVDRLERRLEHLRRDPDQGGHGLPGHHLRTAH